MKAIKKESKTCRHIENKQNYPQEYQLNQSFIRSNYSFHLIYSLEFHMNKSENVNMFNRFENNFLINTESK